MKKLFVVFSCIAALFSPVGVFAQQCSSDSAKVFLYDDITSLMGEYKAVSTDILNVKTTVSKNFTDGEKIAVDKKSGGIQTGMIVGIAGSSIGAIGSAVAIGYNVSSMKSLDKTMATQAKSVSNIDLFKKDTLKNTTLDGTAPNGLVIKEKKYSTRDSADRSTLVKLSECMHARLKKDNDEKKAANDTNSVSEPYNDKDSFTRFIKDKKLEIGSDNIGFSFAGENEYLVYCTGNNKVSEVVESISGSKMWSGCSNHNVSGVGEHTDASFGTINFTKEGVDKIETQLLDFIKEYNRSAGSNGIDCSY